MIRRLLILLAFLAVAPTPALAQNFGNIPPYTVLGNPDPNLKQPARPMAQGMIYNAFPYGWGNTAAGACVLVNLTPTNPSTGTQCGIMGGVSTDPTVPAKYDIGDTVGLGVFMYSAPPWLQNVPGTFTTTDFVPTTHLTSTQIQKLRKWQILDTNDNPQCSGTILSWAADGSRITTWGWYAMNNPAGYPACTPTGNKATVRFTKIYGQNLYTQRFQGDQQTNAVGLELDIINSSGIHDTCYAYDVSNCGGGHNPQAAGGVVVPSDVGLDVVAISAWRASAGVQVRGYQGGFVSNVSLTSPATYGVVVQPVPAGNINYAYHSQLAHIAFSGAPPTDGEFFRNWAGPDPATGAIADNHIAGRMLANGDLHLGLEDNSGTGATHTQYIFSSGHASPDAVWQYAGGTGHDDGGVTLAAKDFYFTGLFTMLKGPAGGGGIPGATYLTLSVEPGTTGTSCKLVARAGGSATGVTVVDNVGSGC